VNDSIAAISTPMGEGGIAIVRLSGPDSVKIVDKVFHAKSGRKLKDSASHTLNLGLIRDEQGLIVDEVLVSKMLGPRSYTGEDVVEINCHGGAIATRKCLETVLNAGARLAEPGEFTKRAFLNGRLDMVQAESVIEVIRARSEKALSLTVRNLGGRLSRIVKAVEEKLILVNSRLEGSIDFPEEVGEPDWEEVMQHLLTSEQQLKGLLERSQRTRVYRDGVRVVIAGKPNVGKSSLLNVLVQKEKAIVTEIPGTTRDVIEDFIYIKGIPIRIMDTAGIRLTRDAVEKMGVEKTKDAIREAEIVMLLLDASTGITEEDKSIIDRLEDKRKLIVINKEDIEDKILNANEVRRLFPGVTVVEVSAREETGIEQLEEELQRMIVGEPSLIDGEQEVMVNVRQERAIRAALEHVRDAVRGVREGQSLDAVAVDTWGAISWIEELTGRTIKADVIERIFADFCIGK